MFIATAAAICGLGHGLCTFAAVHKSTQPGIPLGSLNRVPVSAGIRAGMSALPGGRQHCDLIWHVSSHSGVAMQADNANCYIRMLYFSEETTHLSKTIHAPVNLYSYHIISIKYRLVHCFETLPQKGDRACELISIRESRQTGRHADKATAGATDRAVTGHLSSKIEGGRLRYGVSE